MPLTLSGNGTISDLASAPTVGGTALPTNLSDLGIANHDEITVDSSGRMTNSNQPAFKGRGTHNSATGWWTISNGAYSTLTGIQVLETNRGNCFNNSTGIFTAPVAGYYVAFLNVYTDSTDHLYIMIGHNGNGTARHLIHYGDHGNQDKGTSHVQYFYLNANDTLRWQAYGAGGTSNIYSPNTMIGAALIS